MKECLNKAPKTLSAAALGHVSGAAFSSLRHNENLTNLRTGITGWNYSNPLGMHKGHVRGQQ